MSAVLVPRRGVAQVERTALVVSDLGRAFDGYTIAVLSDFHHAPRGEVEWLRRVVDAANDTSPDLVALLGDYGTSFKRSRARSRRWYREAMAAMTPELVRLRARDAIVAVLGNHDYYAGAPMVREWLERVGADPLVNRARRFLRSGSVLRVAGIDDVAEGNVDPSAGCDVTDRVPTLVLSHNPDGVLHLDARLRVDAMLAGHTHGGQIVIPGYGAPFTMARVCGRRSAHGWVVNPRTPLYVTRGLGAQLPLPIRINCPAEILVLQLRCGPQHPA